MSETHRNISNDFCGFKQLLLGSGQSQGPETGIGRTVWSWGFWVCLENFLTWLWMKWQHKMLELFIQSMCDVVDESEKCGHRWVTAWGTTVNSGCSGDSSGRGKFNPLSSKTTQLQIIICWVKERARKALFWHLTQSVQGFLFIKYQLLRT